MNAKKVPSRGGAMIARKRRPSKREHQQELLDEALKGSFPASDPPAMVGPGGGITGAEHAREHFEDRSEAAPSRTSKLRLAAKP
jgi:hypothetical protein